MKHQDLEKQATLFAVLVVVAISIGGLVELVPLAAIKSNVPTIASVQPYSPLEIEGRDIYVREGCYNCHSQMIRPFRAETLRYGEYSKPGEFIYDRPFQWGSKRTGPDLARVGGKYPDAWHYRHMEDPAQLAPDSIMPRYPWLLTDELDTSLTQRKMKALKKLGTPYSETEVAQADMTLQAQADEITARLKESGIETAPNAEIVAMIAYLQRLGADIRRDSPVPAGQGEQRPFDHMHGVLR